MKKIRDNPDDLVRYKYWIDIIRGDSTCGGLDLFEQQCVAAMMMQIDKYDEWEYDKEVEDIEQASKTGDRVRKMREYVIELRRKSKEGVSKSSDSIEKIQKLIAELKDESGTIKIEYKKEPQIIEVQDVKIIDEEESK